MQKLLFVYNADSGRLNALQDSLHKLISPSTYDCRLCQLTHGFFSEKQQWRTFVDQLDADCVFLHKDEFESADSSSLPAVFLENDKGISELISSCQFQEIETLDQLINTLKKKM